MENFTGAIGTVIFVAYLSALCKNPLHTATQFALLTALSAVGRTYLSAGAGYVAQWTGWPVFFVDQRAGRRCRASRCSPGCRRAGISRRSASRRGGGGRLRPHGLSSHSRIRCAAEVHERKQLILHETNAISTAYSASTAAPDSSS